MKVDDLLVERYFSESLFYFSLMTWALHQQISSLAKDLSLYVTSFFSFESVTPFYKFCSIFCFLSLWGVC